MVFNSVSVAAIALALSLVGAPSIGATAVAAPVAAPTAARRYIAANLWAPKKAAKPKPKPSDDDSAREEELLRSKSAPAPRQRRRIKMEQSDSASEEEDSEEEEEEEEDRPKKKRKRVVEEEDEDDEEEEDLPLPSLPVIRPRIAAMFLGGGVVNRGFKYNTPLQGDSAFRLGYSLALEAYPLMLAPPGMHRRIGIGVLYDRQSGTAGRYDMATGSTVTYPVSQSRLGVDARFFIPAGARVLIVPSIGYGRVSADLQRRTPVGAPSACLLTNADPCFADLNASYLSFDAHLRIAATPELALTLVGGYFAGVFGLGVKSGADQISSSEAAAKLQGFHADLGASLLIKDWFAVQAQLPIRRYLYTLSPLNTTATYHGATDMYYGLIVGLAFLAP